MKRVYDLRCGCVVFVIGLTMQWIHFDVSSCMIYSTVQFIRNLT